MKKIFTFILLAISTLAMAQTFPSDPGRVAAAGTDQITFAEVAASGAEDGFFLVEDLVKPSGATYTVYAADNGTNLKFTDGESDIVTTTSGGRIQSVTVNWASGNTTRSKILIYGKNDEYANDGSEWDDMGTLIGTITYPTTTASNLDTHKCSYIMIAGQTEPKINGISFDWMAVNTYSINATTPTNGKIAVTATTAEPGEKIDVTFTGGKSGRNTYELHSYTIDGKTTNLLPKDYTQNAYKVSFTMPAHNVTISAVFEKAVSRTTNSVTLDSHAQLQGGTITLISGSTYTFGFTADYALVGYDTHAPYQGDVTLSVGNSNLSTLKMPTYSKATGKGSFQLIAYNQGKTKITFTTEQDNDYNTTTIEYDVIVVPREVMLITKHDGKTYAVANSLSAGKLAAQELLMIDGEAYLPSDATYNMAALTWKVCTKIDSTFTIQNSANKFVAFSPSMPETIELVSKESDNRNATWYKYDDHGERRFYCNGNEIIYYNSKFSAYAYNSNTNVPAYSLGAYESPAANIKIATRQALPRNLVQGQFNTVCMPYAFVCPNADVHFYSIECMEEKDGKYNFNFEENNFTSTPSDAGIPYIVRAQDSDHNKDLPIYKIGEEVALSEKNGLIGMEAATTVSSLPYYTDANGLLNIMVFYQGNLMFAKSGKVGANSAYIQFQDLPACTGASSPKRVVLEVEKQESPEIATGVENLSADQINWNEPVYNIMGQRVARGTTGVLIQNGQKFIAE